MISKKKSFKDKTAKENFPKNKNSFFKNFVQTNPNEIQKKQPLIFKVSLQPHLISSNVLLNLLKQKSAQPKKNKIKISLAGRVTNTLQSINY